MGFLDRFRSKREKIGKEKKPKHVVASKAKQKADEEKRRQFAAVPSATSGSAPSPKAVVGKEQPASKERSKKLDTGDAYRILLRAVISEKSTFLNGKNQYVFAVAPEANKLEIKKAIRSLYGVQAYKVTVINMGGKGVRYGRYLGRTKAWKKAIVTLHPGQRIAVTGT